MCWGIRATYIEGPAYSWVPFLRLLPVCWEVTRGVFGGNKRHICGVPRRIFVEVNSESLEVTRNVRGCLEGKRNIYGLPTTCLGVIGACLLVTCKLFRENSWCVWSIQSVFWGIQKVFWGILTVRLVGTRSIFGASRRLYMRYAQIILIKMLPDPLIIGPLGLEVFKLYYIEITI